MAAKTNTYQPNYTVLPGQVLEEMLSVREMSQADFARRCGRSPKLVSEIISGKAPIEPETAIQFEHVLGMDASIWLNLEAAYQLFRAKQQEQQKLESEISWAQKFPIKPLVDMEIISRPINQIDATRKLLAFFGVSSSEAWNARFGELAIVYRHSPSFSSVRESVTAWLRVGELVAEEIECSDFNRGLFLEALGRIRRITRREPGEFIPRIREMCAASGIAFVLFPAIPKLALSGAARWLTPRTAIIQQSLRHKTNDHFWFTFFHEAAHILLHTKKDAFVDEDILDEGQLSGTDIEREANEWAANFLVPREQWIRFIRNRPRDAKTITAFAKEQSIAPGIIVGMLQHAKIIPRNYLNDLKDSYSWEKREGLQIEARWSLHSTRRFKADFPSR
jgi:HTH-type transcriptional regulator/antitoxin HigA